VQLDELLVAMGADRHHKVKSGEGNDDQRKEISTKATGSDFDLIPGMTRGTGHFTNDAPVEFFEDPKGEESQAKHSDDHK
jgi:hypothetical protein